MRFQASQFPLHSLVLAVILLGVGCSEGQTPVTTADPQSELIEKPPIQLTEGPTTMWVQTDLINAHAGFQGIIEYLEEGDCFIVRFDTSEAFPVLWPTGSTIHNEETHEVELVDGTLVEPGDYVIVAGKTDSASTVQLEDACFRPTDRFLLYMDSLEVGTSQP